MRKIMAALGAVAMGAVSTVVFLGATVAPAHAAGCQVDQPGPRTATATCPGLTLYRVCASDRYDTYCGPWEYDNRTSRVNTEYVIVNAWVQMD